MDLFALISLALVFAISLTACGTTSQTMDTQEKPQKLLSDSHDAPLRQLAFDLKKESGPGLAYLEKAGLNLIIILPSVEQIHDLMKVQHQKGEIDDATMRTYDKMLADTPVQERKVVDFIAAPPGFEPSTALPRPYGLKTADGQPINISENFMQRFQVITEYDLKRIIRNSSIILSNFAGPDDHDYFDTHYERLLVVLDSDTALAQPSSEARVSAILKFTASLMVTDSLYPPSDIVLTTEEYYVAALVIGTVYKIF